jgi:hypothetical protein
MYVRLGFAVAAHLRPDILLVDEVLAVGDEAFQHKCLQTIQDMQRRGVSIILVSHGLGQIASLCSSALWLHDGCVKTMGRPLAVIADYLAATSEREQAAQVAEWTELTVADEPASDGPAHEVIQRYERGATSPDAQRWGDHAIVIRDVRLVDQDGRPASTLQTGEPTRIEVHYEVQRQVEHEPVFGIALYRSDELLCFGTNTQIENQHLASHPLPQTGAVIIDVPTLDLLQGSYTLDVAVHAPDDRVTHDYIRAALRFTVENPRGDQGIARLPLKWSLARTEREKP